MTSRQFFILVMVYNEIPFSCLQWTDYEDQVQALIDDGLISTQGHKFLCTFLGREVVDAAFLTAKGKLND